MKKNFIYKKLYFELFRIREIEKRISKEYKNMRMRCPVHLSIGQESIAVGVCQNLLENDEIVTAHRSHAHYLAKGGNLKKMIAELYGKITGCAGGKGGSGIVVISESTPKCASGVWNIHDHFDNVSNNTWITRANAPVNLYV